MQTNLNNLVKNQRTQMIKNQDWESFASLRYDEGDPGSVCYLDDLDLTGRYLGDIPTDFLSFRGCNLTDTTFSGKRFFPMALWSCKAQNIDLRHTHGMLFAYDTDLRGALFDETTRLVVGNSDLPSAFKKCLIDEDFLEFLQLQGALTDFPQQKHIEEYAFGVDKLEKWQTTDHV